MKSILLSVFLSGCTCLTQFEPNSQPCELNAPIGQQCLTGYECRATTPDAGICKRPDAGP